MPSEASVVSGDQTMEELGHRKVHRIREYETREQHTPAAALHFVAEILPPAAKYERDSCPHIDRRQLRAASMMVKFVHARTGAPTIHADDAHAERIAHLRGFAVAYFIAPYH
jgi:hypothetical protein